MRDHRCHRPCRVRRFTDFRRRLYDGDPGYSTTLEFAVESVLNRSTDFLRSCHLRPLLVTQRDEVVAQCVLVHDPALPILQVAFFEALPNQGDAVARLLDAAKEEARQRGLDRIVVGLNAHLSIGVGILVDGFQRASFDSAWNKSYYADYFEGLQRMGLTAYCGSVSDVGRMLGRASRDAKLEAAGSAIAVRPIDLFDWESELEVFRVLCDATLGTTALSAPTQPGHFTALLGDLKPFLRPENLLFATIDGREVGFCFWHPDYNEILPTGRSVGLPGIAWRFVLRRSRIRTVILNALGVLPEYRGIATAALLTRMNKEIEGRRIPKDALPAACTLLARVCTERVHALWAGSAQGPANQRYRLVRPDAQLSEAFGVGRRRQCRLHRLVRAVGSDEGAVAAAGLDDAGFLEFPVGAGDRVAGKAQIGSQPAHGWQAFTGRKTSGAYGGGEPVPHLFEGRHSAGMVNCQVHVVDGSAVVGGDGGNTQRAGIL